MSVKFRLGFDIDAQTLFGMLSKFLPIDNLSVEELTPPAPKSASPLLAKQFVKHLDALPRKSKPKRPYTPRKASVPLRLDVGVNRVIMSVLADDKPHRAKEVKPLLIAAGYSPNSVGSRLQHLERHGIVKRHGDGTWTTNLSKAILTT